MLDDRLRQTCEISISRCRRPGGDILDQVHTITTEEVYTSQFRWGGFTLSRVGCKKSSRGVGYERMVLVKCVVPTSCQDPLVMVLMMVMVKGMTLLHN